MMKLRFNLNGLLSEKTEEQKVALPVEKELNEQELATVTGGWHGGGWHGCCEWDRCGDHWWRHHRRWHRWHHW
jgi:bacteriocin-like protein